MPFNLTGDEPEIIAARESRTRSLEDPQVSLMDGAAWRSFWGSTVGDYTEEDVNEESALSVPAIYAAITLVAGDISAMPAFVYRRAERGRELVETDPLMSFLNGTVNDDGLTFVQFVKWAVHRIKVEGRCIALIENNGAGRLANIWPVIDLKRVKIDVVNYRRHYTITDAKGGVKTYPSAKVLDFIDEPKADPAQHINPIVQHRNTIGAIIAAERYAASIFASGGVPVTIAKAPPASSAVMAQGQEDIVANMKRIRRERHPLMMVPNTVEFESLGSTASDQQLLELRQFQIREVCRIFKVPPGRLADTDGLTYSNSEQQELGYSKHTLTPLLEMMEAEMTAKLIGRKSPNFIKFDQDNLLRNDFATRIVAFSTAVNSGIMKASEAREQLDLPYEPETDKFIVQGAMKDIEATKPQPPAPPPQEPPENLGDQEKPQSVTE